MHTPITCLRLGLFIGLALTSSSFAQYAGMDHPETLKKESLLEKELSSAVYVKVTGERKGFAVHITGGTVGHIARLRAEPVTKLVLEWPGFSSLTNLNGLALEELFIIGAGNYRLAGKTDRIISDLLSLTNMPLRALGLDNVGVSDLTPLKTMTSLSVLSVKNSPLRDLTPIKELKLTSVDIRGTEVSDLSALRNMPLKHLRVEGVSDLSPLKGMRLTTLTFNGSSVTNGTDVLRGMPSLSRIEDRRHGTDGETEVFIYRSSDEFFSRGPSHLPQAPK